jgi:hypothetical protein
VLFWVIVSASAFGSPGPARGGTNAASGPFLPSNRLSWHTNVNRVSADLRAVPLNQVLARIAAATGWKVFLEPGTTQSVSAKFRNADSGEALRLLLGDLSYALLPGTNSRLYVFRSSMSRATEGVPAAPDDRLIPNELVVRLKPGTNAEELARSVGAKIVGRIDDLNLYRLRFDTEEKTNAAREQLASNRNVEQTDGNYAWDRPPDAQGLNGSRARPVQLQLKPPPSNGKVIVGLIDTSVQSLGADLDKFLLKPISVAGQPEADQNFPSHGTAMAETLLRSLEMTAKGNTSVQILPVDVYGSNPTTSTFEVANGVIQAVNNGATVINMSLGSDVDSPFLREVIQEARSHNITVFAAAGNEPVTTPFFPAAYPEVLAVTAVENGHVADYANRGPFISLGAPGEYTIYYQNQPYDVTGTSGSAAFISGAAAGILESGKSPAEMTSILKANFGMRPVQAPEGSGK